MCQTFTNRRGLCVTQPIQRLQAASATHILEWHCLLFKEGDLNLAFIKVKSAVCISLKMDVKGPDPGANDYSGVSGGIIKSYMSL